MENPFKRLPAPFGILQYLASAATINMEGPSPFIAVVLGGQDFLDPATVTTDTCSYGVTDNGPPSFAEAGGRTRTVDLPIPENPSGFLALEARAHRTSAAPNLSSPAPNTVINLS